jgi:hypothetical protein
MHQRYGFESAQCLTGHREFDPRLGATRAATKASHVDLPHPTGPLSSSTAPCATSNIREAQRWAPWILVTRPCLTIMARLTFLRP